MELITILIFYNGELHGLISLNKQWYEFPNCTYAVDNWFEIFIALDPTQVKHTLAEIKLKSQSASYILLMEEFSMAINRKYW